MEADTEAFWENDAAAHMGFACQYGKNPEVRYPMYEVRRNLVFETLKVAERMKEHGFALADNCFFRLHAVPPLLFETDPDLEKVAIEKEGGPARHWIGHFIASAFLATLKKT